MKCKSLIVVLGLTSLLSQSVFGSGLSLTPEDNQPARHAMGAGLTPQEAAKIQPARVTRQRTNPSRVASQVPAQKKVNQRGYVKRTYTSRPATRSVASVRQ
jgi:hypothetical protein